MTPSDDLTSVLARAQAAGFIGPAPLDDHIGHAEAFVPVVGSGPPGPVLDLGSGGGLPGLVIAIELGDRRMTLLDAHGRRCDALRDAVERLGLGARVDVRQQRAEDAGREPAMRGSLAVVTARGFGPPAVTAECAAPLLAVGGRLVVSDPPGEPKGRWDEGGLALLGLHPVERVVTARAHLQLLEQVAPCPERFPRRAGIPQKRPLF